VLPGTQGTQATQPAKGVLFSNYSSKGFPTTQNDSNQIFDFNNLQNKGNNSLEIINDLTDKFTDFPLNLLPEINQLISAELIFLVIIFNVYSVEYITKIDYNKYIPDNRLGKIIKLFINRYIKIWSKSSKILLIISWIGLFFV
jgi:hypothetical protein